MTTMNVGKNRPVALITGASGGIGAALAGEIAKDGYDLVLVSRNQHRLEKVGGDLHAKFGTHFLAIAVDLAQPLQVEDFIESLNTQAIVPELIVNNAGYGLTCAVETGDVTQQLGCINLNVMALSEITLKFLPSLISQNRGGIINVGSIAGFFPGPYFSIYYATKAFVQSFTCAIAYELRASNVKICVICPGTTITGFHKRAGVNSSGLHSRIISMTAEEVAKIGYAGYKKGRSVVVTGMLNHIIVIVSRLMPTSWIAAAVARFNKRNL